MGSAANNTLGFESSKNKSKPKTLNKYAIFFSITISAAGHNFTECTSTEN